MKDIPTMKEKIKVHQNKINNMITEVMTTRETSSVFWTKKLSEIKKEYEEIKNIYKSFSGIIIDRDFKIKLQATLKKIQSLKTLVGYKKIKYDEFKNTDRITNTVNNSIKSSLTDYATGIDNGIKKLAGVLRQTQQKLITERAINNAIEEGFDTTKTWAGSKNRLLLEMLNKIKDGNIIAITDKNGNQRNYDASKYAELVVRTRMRESETNAIKQTALAYDTDLVMVSSHNTSCPICQEYEGKIYSIGGLSKDFPQLDEEPPFHPNCLHLLIVQFREILEQRGIEQYQAFSNNEISAPPYIPSYIPISDRTGDEE
jgi:hypothetical protein